jgi:predicted RNase H-like nuclease (RuvC/YqgF family)
MRNPSSMVLRYDRNNAAWRGCDWMPDDQHDRETEAARSMRDMQKESKKTKTITKKAFSEINVLKQDMDDVYARMEEFNARLNEWKIVLQGFEKTLGEIRQEVKAISDLKAEVGSKYRFLIGSDELQDERLAVLEKRLGIDYLAGTPADSTQPS